MISQSVSRHTLGLPDNKPVNIERRKSRLTIGAGLLPVWDFDRQTGLMQQSVL